MGEVISALRQADCFLLGAGPTDLPAASCPTTPDADPGAQPHPPASTWSPRPAGSDWQPPPSPRDGLPRWPLRTGTRGGAGARQRRLASLHAEGPSKSTGFHRADRARHRQSLFEAVAAPPRCGFSRAEAMSKGHAAIYERPGSRPTRVPDGGRLRPPLQLSRARVTLVRRLAAVHRVAWDRLMDRRAADLTRMLERPFACTTRGGPYRAARRRSSLGHYPAGLVSTDLRRGFFDRRSPPSYAEIASRTVDGRSPRAARHDRDVQAAYRRAARGPASTSLPSARRDRRRRARVRCGRCSSVAPELARTQPPDILREQLMAPAPPPRMETADSDTADVQAQSPIGLVQRQRVIRFRPGQLDGGGCEFSRVVPTKGSGGDHHRPRRRARGIGWVPPGEALLTGGQSFVRVAGRHRAAPRAAVARLAATGA